MITIFLNDALNISIIHCKLMTFYTSPKVVTGGHFGNLLKGPLGLFGNGKFKKIFLACWL